MNQKLKIARRELLRTVQITHAYRKRGPQVTHRYLTAHTFVIYEDSDGLYYMVYRVRYMVWIKTVQGLKNRYK